MCVLSLPKGGVIVHTWPENLSSESVPEGSVLKGPLGAGLILRTVRG